MHPKPKHVLIVDDNVDLADMLADILRAESPTRFNVEVAYDGAQAVSAAARHRPDTVVMDIEMPVLGGFDAALAMRQTAGAPIHLIAVSGNRDKIHAVQDGGTAFDAGMHKPVDIASLIELINAGADQTGA